MKLAAIQMNSGSNISENLRLAEQYITLAADEGANIIVLPENFMVMPENHSQRLDAAELEQSVRRFIADLAKQNKTTIVGGSTPLLAANNKVTNTCLVYGPDGSNLGRYDKIHLFDVALENGETYFESKNVCAGSKPVVIKTSSTCIGLSICYDIRFPELYRTLTSLGAEILTVPSAFSVLTGESHWETLIRARAIENFCWVVAAAQVGNHPGRSTWGHSVIVNPWGEIVAEKIDGTGIIISDANLIKLRSLRQKFPSLNHRRI